MEHALDTARRPRLAGLRPVGIALLAGAMMGTGAVVVVKGNPLSSGGSVTSSADYAKDWTTATRGLTWPGVIPSAPAYVAGGPRHFGRTVAQTLWLCAWIREFDAAPDGERRRVARTQLGTWRSRSDLWLTARQMEPALQAADAGQRGRLNALAQANCP